MESLRNSYRKVEYEELQMIEEALIDIEKGVYGFVRIVMVRFHRSGTNIIQNARRCLICQEASESN